jgi:hypothetical protein
MVVIQWFCTHISHIIHILVDNSPDLWKTNHSFSCCDYLLPLFLVAVDIYFLVLNLFFELNDNGVGEPIVVWATSFTHLAEMKKAGAATPTLFLI